MYLLIARQNADSATFFHTGQIFFGFLHVCIDLIHPFLDAVQLFWDKKSSVSNWEICKRWRRMTRNPNLFPAKIFFLGFSRILFIKYYRYGHANQMKRAKSATKRYKQMISKSMQRDNVVRKKEKNETKASWCGPWSWTEFRGTKQIKNKLKDLSPKVVERRHLKPLAK